MTQPDATTLNRENGKGTAKNASKYSAKYWLSRVYRPRYTKSGSANVETNPVPEYAEVPNFFVRIQQNGRREAVALLTNNRETAAGNATKLYQAIRRQGWDEALKEFRPHEQISASGSVGDHIRVVNSIMRYRSQTLEHYSYCLRRIALEATAADQSGLQKFDPVAKEWRHRADAIKLSELTSQKIEKWKSDYLAKAGHSPAKEAAARRSLNFVLRNAKALFGGKVLRKAQGLGIQLEHNPFLGVQLEPQTNPRYVSRFNSKTLLKKARHELRAEKSECWKAFLLAFGAGLRRREIDALELADINEQESTIQVRTSDYAGSKSANSEDVVLVCPSLIADLKKFTSSSARLVVEAMTPAPALRRHDGFYRANKTLNQLIKWLRQNGVSSDRPLHTLRKEFGSIINAKSDIHTASRQLRHGSISLTASTYTDSRRKCVVTIRKKQHRKTE